MIKRAFFYTTRKRGKTLILLLTLFVISTFVLTGLSILAAADQSALSLRQSVGGSIKLELDKDNRQKLLAFIKAQWTMGDSPLHQQISEIA